LEFFKQPVGRQRFISDEAAWPKPSMTFLLSQ